MIISTANITVDLLGNPIGISTKMVAAERETTLYQICVHIYT